MAHGFVYVLVNSAMPGLVKVGKTSRPPEARVAELSGATGIAVPFVLAYQQEFADCDLAERVIHDELERKGLRPSASREFFRASPDIIIRVIISASESLSSLVETSEISPDEEEIENIDGEPWRELLDEGLKHYFGMRGYFEDQELGVSYLRQASDLGSPFAFEMLGRHYRLNGDTKTSLLYYKKGGVSGNYFCYSGMSELFAKQGHIKNFQKAIEIFFRDRRNTNNAELEKGQKFEHSCGQYIKNCFSLNIPILYQEDMISSGEYLEQHFVELSNEINIGPDGSQAFQEHIDWVRRELLHRYQQPPADPASPPATTTTTEPPKRSWLSRIFG